MDTGEVSIHTDRIYTTSALFAEGEADINEWHEQGFSAVDMEASAVFTELGSHQGKPLKINDMIP